MTPRTICSLIVLFSMFWGPQCLRMNGGDSSLHWSFLPLRQLSEIDSKLQPIDYFIRSKLEAYDLQFQEQAPPRDLLRRLHFDMHGLPPSFERIRAFERAGNPDEAYRREVEVVLASPRYGERWAQHWLDLVRYADTHGYEVNTERPNAWPYRDYVIDAFNQDKPYDQFVFEQLAGDTVGADAATGFLVAAPALLPGQIGQDDASKRLARQDALDEIIVGTGETFLGISIGCARCHEHKFDPISTEDYYAFQAFFAGVEYGDRPMRDPERERTREAALKQIDQQLVNVQHQLEASTPLANPDATSEIKAREPVNTLRNVDRFAPVEAKRVRLTVLATMDDNRHEPCIDELEVFGTGATPVNVALADRGGQPISSGNYSETGIHQLKHVNEGLYGNSHSWISNEKGGGWVQIEWPKTQTIDRVIWSRDRTGQFKDRLAICYRIEVATEPGKWTTVAGFWDRVPFGASESELESLNARALSEDGKQRKALQAKLATLTKEKEALQQRSMVYGGTFREPDTTYVLHRGDPEQPRETITPGVASVLGSVGLDANASDAERRKSLAEWITRPDNPLTARVMVNRIWQFHFGRGLVDTPSDFGINGSAPTHPELLDWLAGEFIRSGWSVKHMHRLILLSKTYRQSSRVHAEGTRVDADARLLWRFPSRRLEAEAIRDSMLQVSGSLNFTMGGAGFDFFKTRGGLSGYPPVEQFGAEGMRRMIYAHKVRMERVPVFGAFDCPDAGQPMPRRNQSITAIQALNLFNSPFVMEQAQQLAGRIRGEWPDDVMTHQLVARTFQQTLGRDPKVQERNGAVALVETEGLPMLCRVLFNSNEFLFIP